MRGRASALSLKKIEPCLLTQPLQNVSVFPCDNILPLNKPVVNVKKGKPDASDFPKYAPQRRTAICEYKKYGNSAGAIFVEKPSFFCSSIILYGI